MFTRALLVIAGLVLVIGAGTLAAAPTPEALATTSLGPNLLFNPSFEGGYIPYVPPEPHPDCSWGICLSAHVAPGWTPYWRPGYEDQNDTIVMPEYKAAETKYTDPVRVRSGDAAQAYFTVWTTHQAGFYQQVEVDSGKTYCFSIWAHSWSANDNDDAYSGPEYGNLRQRVGIDPTGGVDWQSSNIHWSDLRVQPDFFHPFFVTTIAGSSVITVYAYSENEWAVEHNDTYWDDANLRQIEPLLPDGELLLVVVPGPAQTVTKTINPNWLCDPSTSWEVGLDPGGAFSPLLSANSGPTGSALTVTLDSTGLPPGAHETLLYFSSPDSSQAIAAVPARIVVLTADHNLYLPAVISGE